MTKTLNDIKAEVLARRAETNERPHYALPDTLVAQLLKKYQKKLDWLEEREAWYSDEPNKRFRITKRIDVVKEIICSLENPVLTK